ncbi:MAG TPA: amino acid permease [Gemmatimonadales bacterium]|nr:amino acid permease [Gemmatimonadales bacterium]
MAPPLPVPPITAPPALRRSLQLPHAAAMVIGTIIGASIFVQPSEVTGAVPSVSGVFLVWAIAGLLTLFGALICAELSSAFPEAGGVYAFLSRAWSPAVGFLWGWAMFWTMHSGIIAAIATVFARYLAYFAPLGDIGTRIVAIGVIVILSAINYVGVRHGSLLQTAFTAGKLVAVLLMIVVAFTLGARVPEHFAGGTTPLAGVPLRDTLLALVAGLFAFGGWHMVTYTAEETVDAERTIPRALFIGVMVVTAAYIALNAAYLYVLPLDTVARSTRVAADAADALLGRGGGNVMAGLVMFSTFGAVSGIILTGPRVYYAMARDGLLFPWVAAVHPRFQTPHVAIVLQALWASFLVATGTFRALFTRVVYTEWIFFGVMSLGLIALRRRSEYAPRYRVWGYPVVPVLFALSSGAIVVNQVITAPGESAAGLGLVAAGLPVYLLWRRRASAS